MVKGIQSVAVLNIGDFVGRAESGRTVPGTGHAVNRNGA